MLNAACRWANTVSRYGHNDDWKHCTSAGGPREPTNDYYCDYHWALVISCRETLSAYADKKREDRSTRIEEFFL